MDLEQRYKNNIKKELDKIFKTKKVVIWGAGSYGYNIFQIFKKYNYDKYVVAFCDNCEAKWNTTIENLDVLSYNQVKEKYKDDVIFLVCSTWEKEIEKQLINLGERQSIYIPNIYLLEETQGNSLILMHKIWSESNKEEFDKLIYDTSKILEDEESRKVLFIRSNIIKTTDWEYMKYIDINKSQYFLNDFYELNEEEIYIDLGAYNGDTIFKFVNRVCGKYKKIIAFEPDKGTYEILKTNIEKSKLDNIEIYNMGGWDKKDILGFTSGSNSNINGNSHITKSEEKRISVEALDNLFINIPVTFIKIDIEGAEKESLFGAKKIIQKYKPKLAICVYHRWEDIYEIPKIIKSFVPEYKIYLRHHSKNLCETVCYACL